MAIEIPKGATHVSRIYDTNHYFRKVQRRHLNQVSEEWQTLTDWFWWDCGQWKPTESGFCARRLEELR